MVILDLFPAGCIQFKAVVEKGLWFGRSADFIDYGTFHSLTWLRGIGATVFFLGGVAPMTWFVVSRFKSLKPAANSIDEMDNYQDNKTDNDDTDEDYKYA
jgi:nitric oxide reductase subunit B